MAAKDSETLYGEIRLDFFRKVFSGEILPDQQLPPERKQAEELSVSRGTIRKARQLLEAEGYIANTQGSGAVYTPLKTRTPGSSGITAVVCPVHNPFFMSFYRAFEREAEAEGVLVMIKQLDSGNASGLEKVLFSLFLKGIRDIVIWPYDAELKDEYIRRLSGLGMNIVFFDRTGESDYCDSVSVDNNHGISSLYTVLKQMTSGPLAYVGWDKAGMSSTREREESFLRIKGERDEVYRLPWNQENLAADELAANSDFTRWLDGHSASGFICGNGAIGIALKKYLKDDRPVLSIDNFDESEELGLTVYEQPFDLMGRTCFQLLYMKKERTAETRCIKGRVIKR